MLQRSRAIRRPGRAMASCARALDALAVLACVALALAVPAGAGQGVPVASVEVVYSLPHDIRAFTQGLFFADGRLYETTGRRGRSHLAELNRADGAVLRMLPLDARLFGEGATAQDGRCWWLTWTAGRALVIDLADFSIRGEHRYEGEGWGLAHGAEGLYMSDGGDTITVRDPRTFAVRREFVVRDGGDPVALINELEYAHGLLYANIWQSSHVAVIDPASGAVLHRLDLSPLVPPGRAPGEVANGLAWDEDNRCLLITGKLWPAMHCVRAPGFRPAP